MVAVAVDARQATVRGADRVAGVVLAAPVARHGRVRAAQAVLVRGAGVGGGGPRHPRQHQHERRQQQRPQRQVPPPPPPLLPRWPLGCCYWLYPWRPPHGTVPSEDDQGGRSLKNPETHALLCSSPRRQPRPTDRSRTRPPCVLSIGEGRVRVSRRRDCVSVSQSKGMGM